MAKRDVSFNKKVFQISYEILNPSCEKSILFLHGWGSKKEIMKQGFEKVFKEYKHIYVDMPGFGKSPTDEILETKDYKNIIGQFLKDLSLEPIGIFGHSFGGKVATLLNPKHLILLSSAGILEEKPFSVRAKIALFKILKPFGGKKIARFFATSDVSGMEQNMYETLKNVVNEDFTEHFKNYSGQAHIFWGISDSATTLPSGEKISKLIKNSSFFPLEGDHYFFLHHSLSIEKESSFL